MIPALISLRALIADDGYACTFQTLGQYRTALLAALDSAPAPDARAMVDKRAAASGDASNG
jgi:hypothetical protein